ncbi:TetR/AcrR family transcriptional regulator [Paeniglutamicibacter antarcticus]|uniref:TetR/AcrR family transcriptional regulator n=1 Tax=Paeniglutamicibacter antarcticus TaxID=494023 RepID=UPI0031F018B6
MASRRPRAHGLGREVIFAACLELAAATGPEGLSFGKIGRQPGADLTAVYRNFADPDELLLALADRVMAMGREGCLPDPWWR